MKKILILLALLIPSVLFAQKIEKNGIDKFTKERIIETSMERITGTSKKNTKKKRYFHLRDRSEVKLAVRYVDGEIVLPASVASNTPERYTENEGITLLLDNDEAVTLHTIYTGLADNEIPNVRHNFSTIFKPTQEELELLKTHKVISVRLMYFGGYIDFEIPKGKQGIIIKMLKLIEDELQKQALLQNE